MNTPKKITGILFFLQCFVLTVLAESLPKDTIFRHLASKANYEEENIPNYALPNPLIRKRNHYKYPENNGTKNAGRNYSGSSKRKCSAKHLNIRKICTSKF